MKERRTFFRWAADRQHFCGWKISLGCLFPSAVYRWDFSAVENSGMWYESKCGTHCFERGGVITRHTFRSLRIMMPRRHRAGVCSQTTGISHRVTATVAEQRLWHFDASAYLQEMSWKFEKYDCGLFPAVCVVRKMRFAAVAESGGAG